MALQRCLLLVLPLNLSMFLLLMSVCGRSTADRHMNRLYLDLITNYSCETRPSRNHLQPTNVTFGFFLSQIIKVDERNQILTVNAWISQMWIDTKLQWNPRHYGGLAKLHVPSSKIWKPDIVLYNNAADRYQKALISSYAFVRPNGNVTWLTAAIFKSACRMNVRFYPFDEQKCELKFASWAYDGTKIGINVVSEKGDLTNYLRSSEWDLIDISAERKVMFYSCCKEPYPDVRVNLRIRRKPMFYVFNLILPCVLITGIALLGFYMPSDSGEKVTLGVTTLLSTTVFLMLVADSMPPTSDTLPLLGLYYGVTICLVSFATALTVFTLNLHHKGLRGYPLPSTIRSLLWKRLAPMLLIQVPCSEESMPRPIPFQFTPLSTSIGRDQADSSSFEGQFIRVLNKIHSTIERNEMRLAAGDENEAARLEWQQVAQVVDRFLLLIFVVVTILSTVLIIYQKHL